MKHFIYIFLCAFTVLSLNCSNTYAQQNDSISKATRLYKQAQKELKKYRNTKRDLFGLTRTERQNIEDSLTAPIIQKMDAIDSISHYLYREGNYEAAYKLSEYVTEINPVFEFHFGGVSKGDKHKLFQAEILEKEGKYDEALNIIEYIESYLDKKLFSSDKSVDFDHLRLLQLKNNIYISSGQLNKAWAVQDSIMGIFNRYVYTPSLLKDSMGNPVTTWDDYCVKVKLGIDRKDWGGKLFLDVIFTRAYLASICGERDESYKKFPYYNMLGYSSIKYIDYNIVPFAFLMYMDNFYDGKYDIALDLLYFSLDYIKQLTFKESEKTIILYHPLITLLIRKGDYDNALKYLDEYNQILNVANVKKFKIDIDNEHTWTDVRKAEIAYYKDWLVDEAKIKKLIENVSKEDYGFKTDKSELLNILLENSIEKSQENEFVGYLTSTGDSHEYNTFSYNYNMSVLYSKADNKEKADDYAMKCIKNALSLDSLSMAKELPSCVKLIHDNNYTARILEDNLCWTGLDIIQCNYRNFFYKQDRQEIEKIWGAMNMWPEIITNVLIDKDTTVVKPGEKKKLYSIYDTKLQETLYNSILLTKGFLFGLDDRLQNQDSLKINSTQTTREKFTTWDEIRSHLGNNDIAMELYPFVNAHTNDTIWAAVSILPHDSLPQFKILCRNDDLQKCIGKKNYYKELHSLVWKSLEPSLKDVKNIYFSAVGLLCNLPVEYTITASGERMSEKYNMYRLTSTREILNRDSISTYRKIALFGNLKYNIPADGLKNNTANNIFASREDISELFRGVSAGIKDLPETKEEIDSIYNCAKSKGLTAVRFEGEEGSEEMFKTLNNLDINVIHLSTHGMYKAGQDTRNTTFRYAYNGGNEKITKEEEAMKRSFVVMNGGGNTLSGEKPSGKEDNVLTANEISQMTFPNLNLVVLSACDTGLGDSSFEGVFGLQRAFKKAGAHSILMSLSEVSSKKTCKLMIQFYTNLFNGMNELDALRAAQKSLGYGYDFVLLDAI